MPFSRPRLIQWRVRDNDLRGQVDLPNYDYDLIGL
jgi:hypothetical protein